MPDDADEFSDLGTKTTTKITGVQERIIEIFNKHGAFSRETAISRPKLLAALLKKDMTPTAKAQMVSSVDYVCKHMFLRGIIKKKYIESGRALRTKIMWLAGK